MSKNHEIPENAPLPDGSPVPPEERLLTPNEARQQFKNFLAGRQEKKPIEKSTEPFVKGGVPGAKKEFKEFLDDHKGQ